jgi:hypothetical protein
MRVDARKQLTELELDQAERNARSAAVGMNAAASAALVNRTHRVVRERARKLQARRSKMRSLWIPLTVSGGLLVVITTAIWTVLDQYEVVPTGLVDANQQLLVLMMWCLPLSVVLLAVVWFRRDGSNGANEANGSQADNGSRG